MTLKHKNATARDGLSLLEAVLKIIVIVVALIVIFLAFVVLLHPEVMQFGLPPVPETIMGIVTAVVLLLGARALINEGLRIGEYRKLT